MDQRQHHAEAELEPRAEKLRRPPQQKDDRAEANQAGHLQPAARGQGEPGAHRHEPRPQDRHPDLNQQQVEGNDAKKQPAVPRPQPAGPQKKKQGAGEHAQVKT